MLLGPILVAVGLLPGAPHLAFLTSGLVITVLLDGAVIWIERSEYLEQSEVLRAAARLIVGLSSKASPTSVSTATPQAEG